MFQFGKLKIQLIFRVHLGVMERSPEFFLSQTDRERDLESNIHSTVHSHSNLRRDDDLTNIRLPHEIQ